MQIKQILLLLILISFKSYSYSQISWIIPLSDQLSVLENKERLYFKNQNGKSNYVRDDGKNIEFDFAFEKSIGFSCFIFKKDGLFGCIKAGEGEIIPAAFDNILAYTENFFLVSAYGFSKLITKDNKLLLPYQNQDIRFYNYNKDSIFYRIKTGNDFNWGGFLADGSKIDPVIASKRYPQNQKERDKIAELLSAKYPIIFREANKKGLKFREGIIILPCDYDNIIEGNPSYYAVLKEKQWGMIKVN